MALRFYPRIVIATLSLLDGARASDLTAFTDAACAQSWRALDTTNGYPDGLCKPLNVTVGQSFQIQKLDIGCSGELLGYWQVVRPG